MRQSRLSKNPYAAWTCAYRSDHTIPRSLLLASARWRTRRRCPYLRTGKLKQLLAAGAKVDEHGDHGNTPLHEAARAGKPECLLLLVQAGANRYIPNRDRKTAYSIARMHADPTLRNQMLDVLTPPLAGKDTDSQPWSIHYAALRGQTSVIEMLLKMGADPNVKGTDGNTPLHNAALKGYAPVVRLLLERGAKVDTVSNAGTFPLHDAAVNGNAGIVAELIRYGADVACRTAETADTPLHSAASWGRTDAVRTLLAAGASKTAKNGHGRMPLEEAKANGHEEAAGLLSVQTR